jgi:hypothetical protein
VGDSAYEVLAGWLSSLDTDTPGLRDTVVLQSGSSADMTPTLVPTSSGMSLVARTDKLRLWRNNPAPSSVWARGTASLTAQAKARPSAVELASGAVLATVESSTSNEGTVKTARFSADGNSIVTSLTTPTGYSRPAIASDRTRAWVFMVRRSDTALVSREMAANGTWGGDVVDLPPGHDYKWPNTVRNVVGSIKLLVDGDRCPNNSAKNQVLYYERILGIP